MWIVVQHKYGCAPTVVAMFTRCSQAMERAAELSGEFPEDRFYPRLESNFVTRRAIDDIPTGAGTKERSKKPEKSKSNTFAFTRKSIAKEVMSGS